jgi:hypothetical protein
MDEDIFKNNHFNKISRNGVLENEKHSLIKKFGFMSSYMSTSVQSKTKSFIENKSINEDNELLSKKKYKNRILIKKNNSTSKTLILKKKAIKRIKPLNKGDFPLKKCSNIFSYAQKMNFQTIKEKNNKIRVVPKDESYLKKKNLSQKSNSNNTTIIENNNKINNRIKSIVFNQSCDIQKKKKKIESYENSRNNNNKLKYKFLFSKIQLKKNKNFIRENKKYNFDSNTMTIRSDSNSVSTKKEKFSILNHENIYFNNDLPNENETENYYIINNKYSSENFYDKYNIKNYKIVEPCKTFNLVEESNENFYQFDQDISEKRSNDNNNDQNSNLISNNMHNNNFGYIKKESEIYDLSYLKNNYLFNKLSNLLKNTNLYSISPRNDLNEIDKIKNIEPYEKNFKLISDIQKDNEKFPLININSFINLNDSSLFRLMGFIYDYYSILMKTNSLIAAKIKNSFNNIFSKPIQDFSNIYSSFLKVINYYFENSKLIINKKNVYTFNLVIICKIITKEINKSYDISYNYISNNKEYDNLWKIDIIKKKEIKLWLHTELFKVNNYQQRFTYSSQISKFSYGDEIKLEINIFNQRTQLNPDSIQWLPPVITDIETNTFEANKFVSSMKFDPLRCCEIEIQTLIWEEVSIKNNDIKLIKDFIKIFEKNFIVEEIFKYSSKEIFYKIKTVTNKKGIFSKNKFLTFDLNIIDYKEPLKNEIQPIYLMNSNYFTKKLDIRIGTIIIFYITDIKN